MVSDSAKILLSALAFFLLTGSAHAQSYSAPSAPSSATTLAQAQAATTRAPRPDLVLKGDAVCTRCHDEAEAYPVLSIGRTKHGTKADNRTPTCTSCHGESPTHVNKPADVAARPPVDRSFGKKSKTPADVQSAACLTCHEGKTRMFWHEGTHAARDVTCTSCHQVHTGHDKVRDKKEQAQVCFDCHKDKRMEVSKPSRHPILEGKVTCSDCHNPHGSPGPSMVVRGTVNDTCFQCHAEKRGPFIWNHQPVTENCGHCHNPHGTNVASMLKWRAPFLCQQCHEPTSHRADSPTLTFSTGTGAMALGRSCVNCHTNIHGGNNPQGGAESRSLRQ
ncbi:MAG: DmsE family decaheme c-type cytochrome [Rhodospirillales bacterium]|nr:DmsE family decaheme c-type cytochrome [Rhodospirillales bacterium]